MNYFKGYCQKYHPKLKRSIAQYICMYVCITSSSHMNKTHRLPRTHEIEGNVIVRIKT